MRVVMFVLVASLSACTLAEFDADGRACPCGPGYVCDENENRCVSTLPTTPDAGALTVVERDAGTRSTDASAKYEDERDASAAPDASDGGPEHDAGAIDAGTPDAGTPDAGTPDAGTPDAGTPDAGTPDAGTPDAGPCLDDTTCIDPTTICVEGACVPRCDAPGAPACPPSNVCSPTTGRCITALAIGEDCTNDWQCESDICIQTNESGGLRSFCSALCGRTSDCPALHACLQVGELSHCIRTDVFSPEPTFETATPGACMVGSTCQSGVCLSQGMTCVERCSSTADCTAFGNNCWLYAQSNNQATQLCYTPSGTFAAARAPCTADNQCASNICNRDTGTCGEPCCSNTNCLANEACAVYQFDANDLVKLCQPRNLGTTAAFATCQADTDCATGTCIPADATNPAGPRICSTTCCRNSDCAAMGAAARCTATPGPITNTSFGACRPL